MDELMAAAPGPRPLVLYDGSEAQAPALCWTLQQDVGSIHNLQLSGPSTARLLVALQRAAVEAAVSGRALPLHTLAVPNSTNPWPAVVSLLPLLPTLQQLECAAHVSTIHQGAEQLGMILQDADWAPGRLHSAQSAAALMQCLEEEEELEVADMDICTTSGAAAAAAAGPQQSAPALAAASLLVPGGPAAIAAADAADISGISNGSITATSAAAADADADSNSGMCATPTAALVAQVQAGQGSVAASGQGTLPSPLQLLQHLMPATMAQDLVEGTSSSSSTADMQAILATHPAASIYDVAGAAAALTDFPPPLIKQRRAGGGWLPALGALLLPILQQTAHLPPMPYVKPVPLVLSDHPSWVDLTLRLQHEQPAAAPGQQQQQQRLVALHGSVLQQLPHTLKRLCLIGCSACSSSSGSNSNMPEAGAGSTSSLDAVSSAGGSKEPTPGCCCLEVDLRHLVPLTSLQELVLAGLHVRNLSALWEYAALRSLDLDAPLPQEPGVWMHLLQQGQFLIGLGALAGPPPPAEADDLNMVTRLTTSCSPSCGLTATAAAAGGGGAAVPEGVFNHAVLLQDLTLAVGSSPPPVVFLAACSKLHSLVALDLSCSSTAGLTEAHAAAVGALTCLTRLTLHIPPPPLPTAAAAAAAAGQPMGDGGWGGGLWEMRGAQEQQHLDAGAALAAMEGPDVFGSDLMPEVGLGPLDAPSWLDPPLQLEQQQQVYHHHPQQQQQQAGRQGLQGSGLLTEEAWAEQLQRLRALQHLVLPAELLASGGTWLTWLTSLTHLGFTNREGPLPTAAVEHLAAAVQQGALHLLRQVACADTSGASNVQLLSLRELGLGADLQLLVGGRRVWRCAGCADDGPQHTS